MWSGLVLVASCLCGPTQPAAEPMSKEQEQAARAEEFLKKATAGAQAYQIRGGADGKTPFVLQPKPLLRWSNPVVGEIYGGVFLWTADGRPEAVGALYQWYSPFQHRTHEFQSLSAAPLVATKDGNAVWTTSAPGVTFRPVPKAPAPADTPARRLSQMRRLAQQFSADKTDRDGVRRELRLLSQPLYRYGSGADGRLDGGLFALVEGTDPELLLLLEVRQTGGDAAWQFALAPLNPERLTAQYDGTEIWHGGPILSRDYNSHRGTYTKFIFKPGTRKTTP